MEHSNIFGDIVLAFTLSIDLDSGGKLFHAHSVAYVATLLAKEMLPNETDLVFYAALLHDMGGVGKLSEIVGAALRPDKKTAKYILEHPYKGAEILRTLPIPFRGIHRIADYILEHHEKWNGRGYPSRKKGEEILIGAQLIRAADSLDVLVNLKNTDAGNEALSIVEQIEKSGDASHEVVKKLKSLIKEGELKLPLKRKELVQKIADWREKFKLEPMREFSSEDTLRSLLYAFAKVIDSKHPYTQGHSERVASYSEQIAITLGLEKSEVKNIEMGALLHDIGKLSIPRNLLDKPGALEDEEWELVKSHAIIGYRTLEKFDALKDFTFAALHHERWDGKGYPFGLKEVEIPLGARIIAVADMLDALTSKRPYRKSLNFKDAFSIIKSERGRKFDPRVVDAALEALYTEEKIVAR